MGFPAARLFDKPVAPPQMKCFEALDERDKKWN